MKTFPRDLSVLTGKTAVVCRGCLWEQRDGLCGGAASWQKSHCWEPELNLSLCALAWEPLGPAPFQADVRPLLASPHTVDAGARGV